MNKYLFLKQYLDAVWEARLALPRPISTHTVLGSYGHGRDSAVFVPAAWLFERWSLAIGNNPEMLGTLAPCGKGVAEWINHLATANQSFRLPRLRFRDESCTQIQIPDGRHRTAAMLLLGVQSVPVFMDTPPDEFPRFPANNIPVVIRSDTASVVRAFESAATKLLQPARPWWRIW